jgi:hypoxia up-regulated 1
MIPPGRRKGPSCVLLALCAFLFFCSTASAASAVLGIDLGTEYIKAAIAKPGSPIDIVLTKDSKRKEAAALAFKPSRTQTNDPNAFPERLYGGDALALAARYPADVFPNLKPLLGDAFDSLDVSNYGARYPGLALEAIQRSQSAPKEVTVGIKSKNVGDKREAFMVEELLAMELKNIKANAEASVEKGISVSDVVITYPAFYTAQEKRAIELAAELAGLRVLGLISDGTAVGLNYATSRTFDSVSDGAKPEYHLVYDMGAGSTTATVLKFQGRTIKGPAKRNQTIQEVIAMGIGYDSTLGGDSLNDVIVNDMIAEFVEQKKLKSLSVQPADVKSSGKSMARIWKEAERLRQVLSANSIAHVSLEGLYDEDANVKYSLTRDRFEELVNDYAARVRMPLVQALEDAGVTLQELDSIILHGGAVRTPFVQKHLEVAAGDAKKIKTNVNADEAAAMGAAFRAAGLSTSFRVKNIRAHEISGSSITMKWTADGKERSQKLFTPLSQTGNEKQVPLKIYEDATFVFVEEREAENVITEVEAGNVTQSVAQLSDKHGCSTSNITTMFTIRLSPLDGLPEIVSGTVSCKSDGRSDGGVLDNVKGLFGFGGKKDGDQKPLIDGEPEEVDPTEMTPEPVSDPTSSGSTMSAASPSEAGDAAAEAGGSSSSASAKAAKATPSDVVVPLALKTRPVGISTPPERAIPKIRERLSDFDASDRNTILRSEALNTLEAFTYRARDYLDDASFIAVSSDKARKELSEQLSAASEWLYGDGTDAKLADFKDKLKGLKKLVDPVLKRKDESSKRDDAVSALEQGLQSIKGTIEMVENSIKKATEEASSSASSVAAAATASPSTTSAFTEEDLDDDPYGSAAEAEAEEKVAAEEKAFKPYEYSDEDLSTLKSTLATVQKWFDEKFAAQKKLGPYDDPAMLVSDMQLRTKQLQNEATNIIMKAIRAQEYPKKAKGGKKPKPKSKKPSSASSSSSTASQSAASTKSTKDEL